MIIVNKAYPKYDIIVWDINPFVFIGFEFLRKQDKEEVTFNLLNLLQKNIIHFYPDYVINVIIIQTLEKFVLSEYL